MASHAQQNFVSIEARESTQVGVNFEEASARIIAMFRGVDGEIRNFALTKEQALFLSERLVKFADRIKDSASSN